MSEEKTKLELFPKKGKPLLVTDCKDTAVRARLIEIENKNQPNRRKNNAVHIQLFDRIKIGNLNRTEIDIMEIGSEDNGAIEEGYFLCNRNIKDIIIFHSDSENPTCKKCIKIAHTLLKKGLKIYLLNHEMWDKLQNISLNNHVISMTKNMDLSIFAEMDKLINEHIHK